MSLFRLLLLITISLVIISSTCGQLPNTCLYQFTIHNNGEKIRIKDPIYLSSMNPDGYNNQPQFSSPNEVYITTNKYDKDFTDIIKLDLLNSEYTRVTQTDSIGEYSPTPNAIDDYFSVVRREKDGVSQTLHLYPLNQENAGYRVLKKINTVGYHLWLSPVEVALYLITEPVSLSIANISTGKTVEVEENIGRCLKLNKDGELLYVHKVRSDVWYIKAFNLETRTSRSVVQTLPGSEDFEILPDGTLLMANGSSIHAYKPGKDNVWREEADFFDIGLKKLTRMAVSRNKLIIVNENE